MYIGDENDNEQLKDFSIITFKHRYKDRDLGTIGNYRSKTNGLLEGYFCNENILVKN